MYAVARGLAAACVLVLGVAVCVLSGCGPAAGTDGNGNGDEAGNGDGGGAGGGGGGGTPYPVGAVSGTVWAPGNAPGMVPPGHEIPVGNALVWLTTSPPAPLPEEVYCRSCAELPSGGTTTDAYGHFAFPSITSGGYFLVIEKGLWRSVTPVKVPENTELVVDDAITTLPTQHDPDNGKFVPRIALAAGNYDRIEQIMGKMGLGQVDGSGEFIGTSAAGYFDLYSNGGGHSGQALGTLESLVSDLALLKRYHIVFIPCASTNMSGKLFTDPKIRSNLREYVAAGGKLYVTDWSSEWEDVVWPDFIRFASDHDTAPGAAPEAFSDGDGSPSYTSHKAQAVDGELAKWLAVQTGPLADAGTGPIDAKSFVVEGNWNHIAELPVVQVGSDAMGPIVEQAYAWVTGDTTSGGPVTNPLTVTFEPEGCGRVLYSTYHTAEGLHAGLYPQERILLYLIMEIGVCYAGDID